MKLASLFSFLLAIFNPARAEETVESALTLKVKADMLELRAGGKTRVNAPLWQWRVLPRSGAGEVAWSKLEAPASDGTFNFTAPVPASGWQQVEVQALAGGTVVAAANFAYPAPRPFTLLTPERLAVLAETDHKAWEAYLTTSAGHAQREKDLLAVECRTIMAPASKPAPSTRTEFEFDDKVAEAWFATAEASQLADVVLTYQTPTGGWSKGVDYTQGARSAGTHWTTQSGEGWHYCGTLDNRSTTEQLVFLAKVHVAFKRPDCRDAVLRGLEWLLAAQFPNGGWPQVYPLESGYHEAITLNDGAMVHALEVLRAVGFGEAPFTFVDGSLKQRAAAAYDRGLACLLACQVRVQDRRTVWCAQHDPLTLVPVAARLKEPPSLSGAESAELLRFLMRKGPLNEPMPGVIADALAWLEASKITGLRKIKNEAGKTDYVNDPASADVLWARFYDLGTGSPVFPGAQDGTIYTTFHEMAQHNKVAYDYFTTKPGDLFTKEVPKWHRRLQR